MPHSPYEHPLPTLELDTNHINIETGHHQGSFTIKNTGGGQLAGHILSRSRAINFTPSSWTGNSQTISYTFLPDAWASSSHSERQAPEKSSPGTTKAYISSNGGEIVIPITVNSASMTIPTQEGPAIASISDFYDYAQEYPAAARRLFTSSEFYMLLLSTGYEFMEVYENLHKDVNRERAMDNFFILSGLKGKTLLTLSKQHINITQGHNGKIYERFHIQKSDSGYADAPVTTLGGASWLTLSTTRLSSSDYINNSAVVDIAIDPLLIPGNFTREHVQVGPTPQAGNTLEVTFLRAAPFTISLSRKGFRYEDKGNIEIENNTGANMRVDVFSRDRYVRFYAQSHVAGAAHSIPFEIRPTAFAGAQRLFRRLPYISTHIDVRVVTLGQVFHRRLHLNIGEWN